MIDTSNFVYKQSRWQDIFKCLSDDEFDVFSPGIKIGECISKYVVVKYDGGTRHPQFSTDVDTYSIMCYVPKDAYSELEPFVASVKQSMKKLMPMLKPNGIQTPSYYDDTYKAHMVSISYTNYKKVEGGL